MYSTYQDLEILRFQFWKPIFLGSKFHAWPDSIMYGLSLTRKRARAHRRGLNERSAYHWSSLWNKPRYSKLQQCFASIIIWTFICFFNSAAALRTAVANPWKTLECKTFFVICPFLMGSNHAHFPAAVEVKQVKNILIFPPKKQQLYLPFYSFSALSHIWA